MDEFQLIQRYFASLTSSADGVRVGIGDDADQKGVVTFLPLPRRSERGAAEQAEQAAMRSSRLVARR